jgi:hypothetical protein
MATTNGAPERLPSDVPETEPLLGRPGDAAQVSGGSYGKNLVLGMSLTPRYISAAFLPIAMLTSRD